MRHLNTARGQHHKASTTTRRLFTFSESSGATRDAIGGTELTLTGTPTVGTDGWLGPNFRGFNGTTMGLTGGGAGSDAAQLTANAFTIGIVLRRRASAAGTIFCFGGNSGTDANGVLARLKMASDGGLTFEWEAAGAVLKTVAIPTYKLPLNRWTYVHLIRTGATSMQVRANARLIATLNMVTANAGGSTSIWNIAQDEGLASKIEIDVGSFFLETIAMDATACYEDVRRATLQAFPTSTRARVKIKDGLGVYRDMTAQEGHDWLDSFSLRADADAPTELATIDLMREVELFSLANLVTSSKLNLTDVTNLSSYDPLVAIQRDVLIEMARVPLGQAAASTDWVQRFHGHIDEIDWGGDGVVRVSCRDDGGRLVDDFIADNLEMPLTTGGACAVDPVTGDPRGSLEEAIQDLLDQHAYPLTLNAPTPANLCLIPWEQRRDNIMAAARACAGVKAWDFGYRFDESPGQNTSRPTLIDPGRDRIDADGVFERADYGTLSRASIDVHGVRNRVMITFADRDDLDSDLNRVVRTETYEDTTSRDDFGGFFRTIFITEGSTQPIDEVGEADDMGEGILADLKDPLVVVEAPDTVGFFEAELGDIYTFIGDNVHWTGDQILAASAVRLDYKDGAATCVLGLRGKPTAGSRRWLSMDGRPGMNESPWFQGDATWGTTSTGRRAVSENLLERSGWFNGDTRALNRNHGFNMISRGASYMPDLWYRSTAKAMKDTDPMTVGRQRTTTAEVSHERTITATGSVTLKLTGAWNQVSSEMFPVRGARPYALAHNTLTTDDGDFHVNVYWYDSDREFISFSELGFPGPDFLVIASVDDTGAGGRVVVVTTETHGLVVGEKVVITGTTNFNGTFTVRTVVSTTSVEFEEIQAGGAEATGKVRPFFFRDVYGGNFSLVSPGNARYAVIGIERLVVEGFDGQPASPELTMAASYVDSMMLYEVEWDAFAFGSLAATAIDTWATLNITSTSFDHGDTIDTTNDRWRCPESGLYELTAQIRGLLTFSTGVGNFYGLKCRLRLTRAGVTTTLVESLAAQNEGSAASPAIGYAQINGSFPFTRGDFLQVQLKIGTSYAGTIGATPVTATAGADASFLKIKLRSKGR